jgi:hypothetical protein
MLSGTHKGVFTGFGILWRFQRELERAAGCSGVPISGTDVNFQLTRIKNEKVACHTALT